MNDATLCDGRLPPDPTPAEEDASIKEEAIDRLDSVFQEMALLGHAAVIPAAIAMAPGSEYSHHCAAGKMVELYSWDADEVGEDYTGADLCLLADLLSDPAARAKVAAAAFRGARWEITWMMRERTNNDGWPLPSEAEVARMEID